MRHDGANPVGISAGTERQIAVRLADVDRVNDPPSRPSVVRRGDGVVGSGEINCRVARRTPIIRRSVGHDEHHVRDTCPIVGRVTRDFIDARGCRSRAVVRRRDEVGIERRLVDEACREVGRRSAAEEGTFVQPRAEPVVVVDEALDVVGLGGDQAVLSDRIAFVDGETEVNRWLAYLRKRPIRGAGDQTADRRRRIGLREYCQRGDHHSC